MNSALKNSIKNLTAMGMLCAIAIAVNFVFRIPIIPAAPFLKLEIKDSILAMGALIFGPIQGLVMTFACSLLESILTGFETGPIGLLMNFISSGCFVVVAAWIYKNKRNISGAVLGLGLGVLVMTATMLLWNYIITPVYQKVPQNVVAAMLLPVYLPFNAVKGVLNAAVALLLYKPVTLALRRAGLISPSKNNNNKNFSPVPIMISIVAIAACIVTILFLQDIL